MPRTKQTQRYHPPRCATSRNESENDESEGEDNPLPAPPPALGPGMQHGRFSAAMARTKQTQQYPSPRPTMPDGVEDAGKATGEADEQGVFYSNYSTLDILTVQIDDIPVADAADNATEEGSTQAT